MKIWQVIAVSGLVAGTPATALAQTTASPHQHGQPAAPAQAPQANQYKGGQAADSQCQCCEQMMMRMQSMHQHDSRSGAVQKMNMQSPSSPTQRATAAEAGAHQQPKEKPKN